MRSDNQKDQANLIWDLNSEVPNIANNNILSSVYAYLY